MIDTDVFVIFMAVMAFMLGIIVGMAITVILVKKHVEEINLKMGNGEAIVKMVGQGWCGRMESFEEVVMYWKEYTEKARG